MKLFVQLSNEKGKIVGLAASKYVDIDVNVGNTRIASFTLRESEYGYELFDEHDALIASQAKPALAFPHCSKHSKYDWDCDDCEAKSNGL